MSTDVHLPEEFFENEAESVLGTWLYADGEQVAAGAIIAEVMTEKVAHEVEAPVAGTLRHLVQEEDPIEAGRPIARIE